MFCACLDVHKAFTFGVVKYKKGKVLNKSRFDNSEQNFEIFFRNLPPEKTKVVM